MVNSFMPDKYTSQRVNQHLPQSLITVFFVSLPSMFDTSQVTSSADAWSILTVPLIIRVSFSMTLYEIDTKLVKSLVRSLPFKVTFHWNCGGGHGSCIRLQLIVKRKRVFTGSSRQKSVPISYCKLWLGLTAWWIFMKNRHSCHHAL